MHQKSISNKKRESEKEANVIVKLIAKDMREVKV
jgi:hypothetical protein